MSISDYILEEKYYFKGTCLKKIEVSKLICYDMINYLLHILNSIFTISYLLYIKQREKEREGWREGRKDGGRKEHSQR